jgi:hypothetical protein
MRGPGLTRLLCDRPDHTSDPHVMIASTWPSSIALRPTRNDCSLSHLTSSGRRAAPVPAAAVATPINSLSRLAFSGFTPSTSGEMRLTTAVSVEIPNGRRNRLRRKIDLGGSTIVKVGSPVTGPLELCRTKRIA